MDLASKLRRLLPPQSNHTPKVKPRECNLDPFLHGQEADTPFGPCYLIEEKRPLSSRHGHWTFKEALESDYAGLSLFGQHTGKFDLQQALFLDTETTGLAGGTGTYAFLVGLGFFTPVHFVVRQLLMRDYNEEHALLYLLDQTLQEKSTVISFNGKTFDLPLLQTRFAISRLGLEGASGKRHVDLLHMSRRLWKRKLASCSLGSLETHILGVQRSDDIPGAEIPGRYFEFLQTGDGLLLQNIVEHNVLDILSMATLLYRLQTAAELSPEECDCPCEAESLAQLTLAARNPRLALRYLEAAGQLADDDQQYLRVLSQAAAVLKRLGEHEKAVLLWQKILKYSPEDLDASEELAKYYEHRKKDLDSARQITRRALAAAWQKRSPKAPDFEHRLRRLDRKADAARHTRQEPDLSY